MSDQLPEQNESNWESVVQDEAEKRRLRKRRRWLIVLIVAAVVLVGSLAALGVIAFSYLQGQQKYDEIANTANMDIAIDENANLEDIKVDWDALRKANPDTVAWVYMPGTPINYPVVQGEDNEHYLYYDFDGDAGWLAEYGSVFLDYRNKKNFTDPVSFIYGHHMNDGSMFAYISNLEEQSEFDSHRIAYVLTPEGNYRLRSFSIVHCAPDDPIVETTFTSKKEMTKYVQDKIGRSVADVGDIPKAADIGKVFVLATCDSYSAGRDVLFTYVLDTTAVGLEGEVGIDGNKNSTWLVDDLETKE